MADIVIVGAGWAGAVCARQLAEAGRRVLIVDLRDHVGGNAYDYVNPQGVRVGKYGAHIFHTNSARVWHYVSRFTNFRPYTHRVLSQTTRGLVPVPINSTTLDAFGGDLAAAESEMIAPYTQKQWGPLASQLAPTVLGRIRMRASADDRYFLDAYQGMPEDGYTACFERLLDHPLITVGLEFAWQPGLTGGPLIWTGPIDDYFNRSFGQLAYRSAKFELVHWYEPARNWLPAPVVNYPDSSLPYTRAIEFRQMTGQQTKWTTVAYEYPTADGDPFWPVPTVAHAALYCRYCVLAKEHPNVRFCGRLGTYRYMDMDATIAQALKCAATFIEQEARTMTSLERYEHITDKNEIEEALADLEPEAGNAEPAAASPEGHSPIPQAPAKVTPSEPLLTFHQAIDAMMNGAKCKRIAWEDQKARVYADGLLRISIGGGPQQDWIISIDDVLATDWIAAA